MYARKNRYSLIASSELVGGCRLFSDIARQQSEKQSHRMYMGLLAGIPLCKLVSADEVLL